MEVERAGAVPRAHHNMQPLTKQITPVKVTKTVSVATIFKQQPHRIKKRGVKSQPLITIPKLVVQGIKDDKAQSLKSLSSSHNAKIGAKGSRKRPDLHPLAVAFKGTCVAMESATVHATHAFAIQTRATITAVTFTIALR
jgi:hypothetical protein